MCVCVSVVSSIGGTVLWSGAVLCVSGLLRLFFKDVVCVFGKCKTHKESVDYLRQPFDGRACAYEYIFERA